MMPNKIVMRRSHFLGHVCNRCVYVRWLVFMIEHHRTVYQAFAVWPEPVFYVFSFI
jgi:hypothetical protein